jgi:Amidase
LKKVHTSACALGCFGQFNDMFKETHEHPLSVYRLMFFYYNLPRMIQLVLKNLVSLLASKRLAMSMDCLKEYTRQEIDDVLIEKMKFEMHMAERIEKEGIDAIISPAYYHSAFKHEDGSDLGLIADYTTIWNTLSYPAGVVPVTEVLPEDNLNYTDKFNDILSMRFKNSVKDSVGMPVNV